MNPEGPVERRPSWAARLLPSLHVGRTLAVWLAVLLAYTAADVALAKVLGLPPWSPGEEFAASLGVVLGVLVVFRINTAYNRWWEARQLWGQLVNDSRNLALKVRAHVAVDAALKAACRCSPAFHRTRIRTFGQCLCLRSD